MHKEGGRLRTETFASVDHPATSILEPTDEKSKLCVGHETIAPYAKHWFRLESPDLLLGLTRGALTT